MTIITRKIKLLIDEKDKKKSYEHWKEMFRIADICRISANYVSSHMLLQDFMKDLIYLNEDVKVKLADISKDELGILNTSSQNSTYRLLSKKFKGTIPAATFNSINATIRKTYDKEKKEVLSGEKSLRTYRQNIPIPVTSQQLKNGCRRITYEYENEGVKKTAETFGFSFFSVPLSMYFGRDRSGNRLIVERSFFGDEYKLCNSSIQIKKNRQTRKHELFLLLTVDIPQKSNSFIEGKEVVAKLSPDFPMVCSINDRSFKIGTKDEYTYRRLRIQAKLRKLQMELKYSKGGKGRAAKLKAIDRYHDLEKNYINTKLHQYSRELVNICVKNRCAKLVLLNINKEIEEAKENDFLLRNWSYFGLIEKIKYKANIEGIEVTLS